MRTYGCNESVWKFLVIIFGIFIVATFGPVGCGGGGGGGSSNIVPPTNNAPVITSTAPQNAIEEVKYSYNPVATDTAGDVLTWSITNQPNGMTIDPITGEIAWTPAVGVKTSGSVTLTVVDNGGLTDTQDFTVTVFPAGNIVPVPPPGTLSVRISSVDTSNCPSSVSVLLNLLDEEGNLVTDSLPTPDFTVTYNGALIPPGDITQVEYKIYDPAVDGPFSVSMVLDASGSLTTNERSTSENALAGFVRDLNPDEAAEVIKFQAASQLMQSFTTDQQALVDAIFKKYDASTGIGSVLYTAINNGLTDIAPRTGRKAVVAVSDGDATDTGIAGNVIANAIADGIPVYTIGLGAFLNPANLSELADRTGGIYYELASATEMYQAFQSLGQVLDEKWVITFKPPLSDGLPHDLVVDVTTSSATGSGTKSGVVLCP
jgi:Putative Ig domain/von Willebrand factor type A domain